MPPDTTLALFAREEARAKAPAALHEAVKRAGGQVVAQMTVKPWELRQVGARAGRAPRPLARRRRRQGARRAGRASASSGCCASSRSSRSKATGRAPSAAQAGARGRTSSAAPRTRPSGAPTRWPTRSSAGTRREATARYLRLREQGERLSGLIYLMAQRLRDALAVALRLQAGESVAEIKRGLRMPARAAERFIADVAAHRRRAAARGAGGARRPRARLARRRAARRAAARPLAALERGHARAARDRSDHRR